MNSNNEKIAIWSLIVAIIAIVVAVTTPEIREYFGLGRERIVSEQNNQSEIQKQREEAIKQQQRQNDEENKRKEAELRKKEQDLLEEQRKKNEAFEQRQSEIEEQSNRLKNVSNVTSYDSEYIGVWERIDGTHSGGSYKITVTGENNQLVFTYLSGKVQRFDMPYKGERIMYADKGTTWGTLYTMIFEVKDDKLIYSAMSSGGGQNGTITYKRIR